MDKYVREYPIQEALSWDLHKTSLSSALIDETDYHYRHEFPDGDSEPSEIELDIVGDNFVVTFFWGENTEPT